MSMIYQKVIEDPKVGVAVIFMLGTSLQRKFQKSDPILNVIRGAEWCI